MAILLEIFHANVSNVGSKEHINYFAYCHIEYMVFSIYGLYCNETKEHQSESFLEKIAERHLHGFFDTFILEDNLVKSFVDGIVPLEILKQNKVKKGGIFHCCPLNRELVKEGLKLGFYISFCRTSNI